jgi:hypothetical protein
MKASMPKQSLSTVWAILSRLEHREQAMSQPLQPWYRSYLDPLCEPAIFPRWFLLGNPFYSFIKVPTGAIWIWWRVSKLCIQEQSHYTKINSHQFKINCYSLHLRAHFIDWFRLDHYLFHFPLEAPHKPHIWIVLLKHTWLLTKHPYLKIGLLPLIILSHRWLKERMQIWWLDLNLRLEVSFVSSSPFYIDSDSSRQSAIFPTVGQICRRPYVLLMKVPVCWNREIEFTGVLPRLIQFVFVKLAYFALIWSWPLFTLEPL